MRSSEKKPSRNKPATKQKGRVVPKKNIDTRRKSTKESEKEKPLKKTSPITKRTLKSGSDRPDRPVRRESGRSDRPIRRDSERSDRPIRRDSERSDRPIKRDSERLDRPIRRDSERSDRPIKRDSERSDRPVKRDSERSDRPIRRDSERSDRPVKRDSSRTSSSRGSDSDRPVKRTYQRDDEQRNSLLPGIKSVRLNKYIATAGICSRRDADKLIESGMIKINGKTVTELGTKVNPGDVIQYGNQKLKGEALRYVLLNKPKGFICTMEDPQDRRTVMELVKNACVERIYPVGRLDRNTTGLLLLTNDGDLAKKLTHPRHRIKKVYQVELNKALTKNDMQILADGIELEDGRIELDAIAYLENSDDKKKVGIEIHSGRNRIVRRMFEKLQYDVVKLDRVIFASLTKKDLPRGKWRHLTPAEINILRRVQ